MAKSEVLLLACDLCSGDSSRFRNGYAAPGNLTTGSGDTPAPQSFAELREALAQEGWYSDHANDRDLCPSCVHAVGPQAGDAQG